MARGLEALHVALALARGLVRVFDAIIEIAILTMFYPGKELALGGPVALQLVGDDDSWHVRQALEEFTREFLRGLLVSPTLH